MSEGSILCQPLLLSSLQGEEAFPRFCFINEQVAWDEKLHVTLISDG